MVVVVVCGAVAVAVVMMVTITVAFGCCWCWAVVRVMRALRRSMVVVVVSILEIVRWSMMMMISYNVMRV